MYLFKYLLYCKNRFCYNKGGNKNFKSTRPILFLFDDIVLMIYSIKFNFQYQIIVKKLTHTIDINKTKK